MKSQVINRNSVVALLALSVLATACGGNVGSDPSKKYNLEGHEGPRSEVNSQKQFVSTLISPINPETNKQVLIFPEGKTTEYVFETTGDENIVYKWNALNLPAGAKFGASKDKPRTYVLSYTPPTDVIPEGKGESDLSIRFQVQIVSTTYAAADVAAISGKTYSDTIKVTRAVTAKPQIEAVQLASTTVTEGDKAQVTIVAVDPVGAGLTISATADKGGTSEVKKIDLSQRVSFEPAEKQGDRVIFKGLIDTAGVSIPKNKNEVLGRFLVSVSGDGGTSSQQGINITIVRKPAPQPEVTVQTPVQDQKAGDQK